MLKFLKRLSWTQILLVFLVFSAIFTRLYNLENSLSFQGDQGRDALIVAQIFTQKDLVFIGPVTSVGNMYLGPLYYYFMLPFLWLSYPNPMGPAYAVAILGIISVWLSYRLGKKMIGSKAALIATLFFTFSSTVMTYARFSWNPNPAPLVAIFMIYFTYQAWQKNPRYWLGVALGFAILLQLHYLTLLSVGGAGIVWLISLIENWKLKRKNSQLSSQLKTTALGLLIVIASFTPLVLFDWKHDWLNATAFKALIFQDRNFKTTISGNIVDKIFKTIMETHGRGMHTLFEIAIGQQRLLNTVLLISFALILGWLLIKNKKNKHWPGWVVISSYLITGIIGTALYEHTIFDHYIAYLFPVTFWVYGIIIEFLITKWKLAGKIISSAFLIYFCWFNLPRIPIRSLGWTIKDMRMVADNIYQEIKPGEKYDLVLFSESRDLYGQNYRYFLTTTDKPPVKKTSSKEIETLVIIDENHSLQDIVNSPVYEIMTFPDKKIKGKITIPGGPEVIFLSTRSDR